ncbi:MAG TPA: SMC-Scp complex subunit ScpB [Terracidiphilus sp.]|jgi:segregation and condensation protein B
MSLKAKLEAVIYAAEEPVTLTQLAALFAADALEWKAAQAAAAAEQAAEVAGVAPDSTEGLPLLAEGLEYLGLAETPAVYAELAATGPAEPAVGEETAANTGDEAAANAVQGELTPVIHQPGSDTAEEGVTAEAAAPAPADMEADLKRQARQRDREVRVILKQLLDELIASCEADGRGVEIREIAGGYRMATKPECHDAVRMFVKSLKPAMKLSLPALETLAVIAYKQPVTAPEVNEIRGVESGGVLGSLLARKLIATAGRKQVIGRPILYKTTREFLLRFGLKDVSELPSMEEFEKMAEEIELEEPESGEAAETRAEAREEGAEAELQFNSPSGEELAGTAESVEGEIETPAVTRVEEPAEGRSEEDKDPAVSGSTSEPPAGPAEVQPADDAVATPETSEQAEIEAVPHAEEEQKER